jgi:hypothetical protein
MTGQGCKATVHYQRGQRLQQPGGLTAQRAASAKRRNEPPLGSGNEKENTMQILIKPAAYAQMLLNCTGLEPDADAALRMLLNALRDGEGLLKNAPTEWVADVILALHGRAHWDANHDEKGNWTGTVRNENGWTP